MPNRRIAYRRHLTPNAQETSPEQRYHTANSNNEEVVGGLFFGRKPSATTTHLNRVPQSFQPDIISASYAQNHDKFTKSEFNYNQNQNHHVENIYAASQAGKGIELVDVHSIHSSQKPLSVYSATHQNKVNVDQHDHSSQIASSTHTLLTSKAEIEMRLRDIEFKLQQSKRGSQQKFTEYSAYVKEQIGAFESERNRLETENRAFNDQVDSFEQQVAIRLTKQRHVSILFSFFFSFKSNVYKLV